MLVEGGISPLMEGAFRTAWRHLRSMRANPPGAAGLNPDRRAMFTAAMEQAQQLFAAGAEADVMTKPLQLFYGLSQAGRAIAAAAPHVPDRQQDKPPEPWKLSGHGLAIPGTQQSVAACAGQAGVIPVADKGTGAFTQMAGILGCGSLIDRKPDGTAATRVTVGEIWQTLPESLGFPLSGPFRLHVLAVDNRDLLFVPRGNGLVCGSVEGVPNAVKELGTPEALKEFLAHYPAAGSWTLPSERLGTDFADLWFPGRIHPELNVVALLWPEDSASSEGALSGIEARVGARYFNDAYLFPALGDNTLPLHPLLAWWAVLYVLSMIARYEPCAWTEITAINSSREAGSIEHLLEIAAVRLPRLVLDVIDELTS